MFDLVFDTIFFASYGNVYGLGNITLSLSDVLLAYIVTMVVSIVMALILRVPLLPSKPYRYSFDVSALYPTPIIAIGIFSIFLVLNYTFIYNGLVLAAAIGVLSALFVKYLFDFVFPKPLDDDVGGGDAMNEIIGIVIAAILCWLNFVIVDTYFGLPEQPGVKGARIVGENVKKRGGDIAGGFFQGNILCSPDASAGTLLASIGYFLLGIPGGIIVAFLVFIGNRLCADPGYAGTVGSLTATMIVFVCSFVGLTPEMFIVGMVIAILTIQGIDQVRASIILGKIAQKLNRHAKE